MLLLEHWKPVVGWEGIYEVSNCGNVRNVMPRRGTRPHRIVSQHVSQTWRQSAYPSVGLSALPLGRKHTSIRVHCLVAAAFIGERPKRHEVNHKDGFKLNNRVSNLEYVTNSRNQLHAYETGLQVPQRGEIHHRTKLTDVDVVDMRYLSRFLKQKQLRVLFDVSENTVWSIIHYRNWRHVR